MADTIQLSSINLDPGRLVSDVLRDLNDRIRPTLMEVNLPHGFSCLFFQQGSDGMPAVLPKTWKWIACYAVRGGSEGYYVHIELLSGMTPFMSTSGTRQMLSYEKLWSWDHAFKLAQAVTLAFDA